MTISSLKAKNFLHHSENDTDVFQFNVHMFSTRATLITFLFWFVECDVKQRNGMIF